MSLFPLTPTEIEAEIIARVIPSSAHGIYRRALAGRSPKACIQAMCLECQGWEQGARAAIRDCPSRGCPLWSKRPYQAEEQEDTVETLDAEGEVGTAKDDSEVSR